MEETKTLTQQAQEMLDKEMNDIKVKAIYRAIQQKERNNRNIADYTKQNVELDELIAKVEAGDKEALDTIRASY